MFQHRAKWRKSRCNGTAHAIWTTELDYVTLETKSVAVCRTIMNLIRPVKNVSKKSILGIWAPQCRYDYFPGNTCVLLFRGVVSIQHRPLIKTAGAVFARIWDSYEGFLFLETDCSCSPKTNMWRGNSYIPHMNEIDPPIQGLVMRTFIHRDRRNKENLFTFKGTQNMKIHEDPRTDIFLNRNRISFLYTLHISGRVSE